MVVKPLAEEKPSINNVLDNGVLHHVFDHLGARDMARVSCVCRLWHALTQDAQCNRRDIDSAPPLPLPAFLPPGIASLRTWMLPWRSLNFTIVAY